jgi:hypothetical protein
MTEANPTQSAPDTGTSTLVTVIGFVLYLAAGLPYLVGGLIMPWYAVGVLWAVWVVGLALAIRWRNTRRTLFLALPFIALGIWFAVSWLGDTFLGWTA